MMYGKNVLKTLYVFLFSNRIQNNLQRPEGLIFVDSMQFKKMKFEFIFKKFEKVEKTQCDNKLKKLYFLHEHNIQTMWCKNGDNPINSVLRVAN